MIIHFRRQRLLFWITAWCVLSLSSLLAQTDDKRFPHRVISAEEIKKAGDEQFKLVLHYLLPGVFPRTVEGWNTRLDDFVFYVDNERCEPEYLDDLDPHQVKRISIWEKRWEPTPMAFPNLAYFRYVVSIETI
jgi:hypothetical protein